MHQRYGADFVRMGIDVRRGAMGGPAGTQYGREAGVFAGDRDYPSAWGVSVSSGSVGSARTVSGLTHSPLGVLSILSSTAR